jgi:two-component system response regulator MprA
VQAAWPHGAIVHDNTLDVYIARLRRKLGALPGSPHITTVHGIGYSLR